MKEPYGFLKGMDDLTIPAENETINDPDITTTVDPEDDLTKIEEPVVDDPTVTVGTENLGLHYHLGLMDDKTGIPVMSMPVPGAPDSSLNIRTSNGKDFRVYFKAEHFLTEVYITRLCRFLDSRTPDQTVTFYMGCKLPSRFTMIIGAILSAVNSCVATTKAVAAGCCGIPESMIWCFCNERTIELYGALTFGGTDNIKFIPYYKSYLDTCYEQAKRIGIIKDDEILQLWYSNAELLITYHDAKDRGF